MEKYEEVARHLLNELAREFHLGRVEGDQVLPGKSGTNWTIEAKAATRSGEAFLIIECRRYTRSRLNQESMGALAYRIKDTGASGAIVVSPLGLQTGAQKVSTAENILSATLDPSSTTKDYVLKFLGRVFVGASIIEKANATDASDATVIRGGSTHATPGNAG